MPGYRTYVLQGTEGGSSKHHSHNPRTFKARTYVLGNLDDPSVHNRFFIPRLSKQGKRSQSARRTFSLPRDNHKKNKNPLAHESVFSLLFFLILRFIVASVWNAVAVAQLVMRWTCLAEEPGSKKAE